MNKKKLKKLIENTLTIDTKRAPLGGNYSYIKGVDELVELLQKEIENQ